MKKKRDHSTNVTNPSKLPSASGQDLRRQAEKTLQERERQYQLISENMADSIAVFDMNLNYTYLSPSTVRLLGYTPQELMALGIEKILTPNSWQTVQQNLNEEMAFENSGLADPNRSRIIETEQYRKDGSLIWVEGTCSFIRNENGEAISILASSKDITRRKQLERQLHKAETRFHNIIETLPGAAYIAEVGEFGRFLYISPQIETMLGYTPEEWMSDPALWISRIYPDDRDSALKQEEKALNQKGRLLKIKYRMLARDGSLVWINDEATVVPTEDGQAMTWQGVLYNITTQVEAKVEIENLARFPAENPNPVLRINREGMLTYANQAALSQMSYWNLHVSEPAPAMLRDVALQAMQTGKIKIFDLEHTGRVFSFFIAPIASRGYANLYGRDITDSRQMKELRIAESNYHNIFERAPVGIFQSTPEGRYLKVNLAMTRMFGFESPEEMLSGITDIAGQLYVDPARRQEFIHQMTEHGQVLGLTNQYFRKDGSSIWCSENTRGITDKEGKVLYYEGFLTDITEQKRMETTLIESEKNYRNLFGNVPAGLYRTLPDGRILDANPALVEMFGYPNKESMLDQNANDLYADMDDRVRFNLSLEQNGVIPVFETQFKRRDGTNFWAEDYVRVIHNDDGSVLYYEGCLIDVTKRKQAEETLTASEAELRALFAAITDVVILCDADGRYLKIAPTNPSNLYRPPEDMLGKTVHDVLPKEQADYIVARIGEALQTGQVVTGEYALQIEGKELWLASSFSKVTEDTVVRVAHDITKRKQVEEELRKNEVFVRTVLDNLPIGIAVNSVNPTVTFDYMNDNFLRFYRTTRDKLATPDAFWNAVYEEPAFREEIKKRVLDDLASGDPERMRWADVPITRKGEETTIISAQNIPIPDRSLMISAVWDVTKRKQVEEELAQTNKRLRTLSMYWLAAIENEHAYIARELHDEFGQSMTALKMDLDWLADKYSADNEECQRINRMKALVDDSISLMRDIASKLRPGLLDDLGLFAALEWQAREFTKHSEIPCELSLPPHNIDLDPDLSTTLFRIFQEALTNITRHAQATRVDTSLRLKDQTVILTVQDNGRGITESEANNPRSLGLLGLRERAAQWNGSLTLAGKPGEGTTVTVRIPLPRFAHNINRGGR